MGKPAGEEDEDWFNLLALHQKRSRAATGAAASNAKSINERALPSRVPSLFVSCNRCLTVGAWTGVMHVQLV